MKQVSCCRDFTSDCPTSNPVPLSVREVIIVICRSMFDFSTLSELFNSESSDKNKLIGDVFSSLMEVNSNLPLEAECSFYQYFFHFSSLGSSRRFPFRSSPSGCHQCNIRCPSFRYSLGYDISIFALFMDGKYICIRYAL